MTEASNMSSEYDDEVLYYDNMEILSNFVKPAAKSVKPPDKQPKKASPSPLKASSPMLQNRNHSPKVVSTKAFFDNTALGVSNRLFRQEQEEKPPALPPKQRKKGKLSNIPGNLTKTQSITQQDCPPVLPKRVSSKAATNVQNKTKTDQCIEGKVAEDKGSKLQLPSSPKQAEKQEVDKRHADQPTLVGIRSLVDAPLPPILEEDVPQADSSCSSSIDGDDESATSLDDNAFYSPVSDFSNGDRSETELRADMKKVAPTSTPETPRQKLGTNLESAGKIDKQTPNIDSIKSLDRRQAGSTISTANSNENAATTNMLEAKSTASKHDAVADIMPYAENHVVENSDSKAYQSCSSSSINEPDDEEDMSDDVTPYGMVDLSRLDQKSSDEMSAAEAAHNIGHELTSASREKPSFRSFTSPEVFSSNRLVNIPRNQATMNAPEHTIRDNFDSGKGKHSTAVSTLDRHGALLVSQARFKVGDKSNSAASSHDANVKVSNFHGTNNIPSSHHMVREEGGMHQRQSNPVKRQERALPPKPKLTLYQPENTTRFGSHEQNKIDRHNNLEDCDSNPYHEVDFIKPESRDKCESRNNNFAMTEIQEILDIIKIPNVFYESQTIAVHQFPVGQDESKHEPAQYDNFSVVQTNKLSKHSNAVPHNNEKVNSIAGEKNISPIEDLRRKHEESANSSMPNSEVVLSNMTKAQKLVIDYSSSQMASDADKGTLESLRSSSRNQENQNLFNHPPLPPAAQSDSSSDANTVHSLRSDSASHMTKKAICTEEHRNQPSETDESLCESANQSQDDRSVKNSNKYQLNTRNQGSGDKNISAVQRNAKLWNESAADSDESLVKSTQSLNRTKSRDRKKSPLRAKFKFRSRSKSQDRAQAEMSAEFQNDSLSAGEEKSSNGHRKGSRLSRRISRKFSERRGRSAERKAATQDEEVTLRQHNHNPVSFIRKLLRKSKEFDEDPLQSIKPNSNQKSDPSDWAQGTEAFKPTKYTPEKQKFEGLHITAPQSSGQRETRNKVMTSPPSRRARKMLHSKPTSHNNDSSSEGDKMVYQTHKNFGANQKTSATLPKNTRIRHMESGFHNSSSSSDLDVDRPRSFHNEDEKAAKQNTTRQHFQHYDGSRSKFPMDPASARSNSQKAHLTQRGRRRIPEKNRRQTASTDQAYATQQRRKYRTLVSLNAQTLKKVTEKWLTEWRNRLPVGGFLITSWSDIILTSKRPQCILGNSIVYMAQFSTNPDHKLSCQMFEQRQVNPRLLRQLENCSMLTAHPNLCNVCSHFFCRVPGSLLNLSSGDEPVNGLCVVLANQPSMSITKYLEKLKQEEKDPKQVHKNILMILLQLLQVLDDLLSSGFNIPCITANHLIVAQENGLLQVLPHMDCSGVHDQRHCKRFSLVQQVAQLLLWMLENEINNQQVSKGKSYLQGRFAQISQFSYALNKIVPYLSQTEVQVDPKSAMRLVQCALWGPTNLEELGVDHMSQNEALELWIDVEQAKLVNNLAVLLTAKNELLPIYMFYKHQYFSQVVPQTLLENLKILELL